MNKRKSGISDVVATVIIVAATVAIALVAIAYFTGIVGGATSTQRLELQGITRVCEDNGQWYAVIGITNSGSKDVTITGIQVGDSYVQINGNSNGNTQFLHQGGATVNTDGSIVIPAGSQTIFKVEVSGTFTAGSSYHLEVYSTGNVQLLAGEVQAYSSCPTVS